MGQGDRVVADGLLVQHPVPTVFFVAPPLDKLLFRELGHPHERRASDVPAVKFSKFDRI